MLDSSTSPKDLAALLGTSYGSIHYLFYKCAVDSLYTEFEIPKKSRGMRKICAPIPQVKNLQQRLASMLVELYEPKNSATAFISGRGIVFNAKKHTKRKFVFNVDLMDFFSSINFGRVRGMLIAPPYNLRAETAAVIAQICCFRNGLPQGAPTSPVVSNMICARLDRELSNFAARYKCVYSRYADDITFSLARGGEMPHCMVRYGSLGEKVGPALEAIIKRNGFDINEKKVRLQGYRERQVVTGLKVNKKVNVDRRYIRKTKAMIHSLEKDGVIGANQRFSELFPDRDELPPIENVIQGRLLFIHMVKGVDSEVYAGLAKYFNSLPIPLKVPVFIPKSSKDLKKGHGAGEDHYRVEACRKVMVLETTSGEDDSKQGTAFLLGGNIITCSHNIPDEYEELTLFGVTNPSAKYSAKVLKKDAHRDVAILTLEEEVELDGFQPGNDEFIDIGSKVTAYGFPQYLVGKKSVDVKYCNVTNKAVHSGVQFFEVDKNFIGGGSGGPVVNEYHQVVGMVSRGIDCMGEGMNAFISLSDILAVLGDP